MADFTFTIGINTNPYPFRVKMFEASAPSVVVATQDVALPHTASQQVVFAGLNDVSHYCEVYELIGSSLGDRLYRLFVQPKQKDAVNNPDIELVVGTDMAADQADYDGSTDYPDYSGLIAGTDYTITRRGIGPLKASEFVDNPPFGFSLVGDSFHDLDTFFIKFYTKVKITPGGGASPTSGKMFTDVMTVTVDTSLDSTYLNKLVSINSDTSKIVLTLDFLANIPDMSFIGFSCQQIRQKNAVIKAQTGELIYWNQQSVGKIVLSPGESLILTKKGTKFYVVSITSNHNQLGNVIYGYRKKNDEIEADGSTLLRDVYVKLWDEVSTMVDGVVDQATFDSDPVAYATYFTTGDGSTTFQIPTLSAPSAVMKALLKF